MTQQAVQANPDWYQWGVGAVSPTLPTYVEREADHQIVEELLDGKLCYVLTARQMGKSSLVVRAQGHLRKVGVSSANIDLSRFGKSSTEEQWYYDQVDSIANDLGLPDDEVSAWWDQQSRLSVVQRFTRFLSDFVLERVPRVVVFIDEIDSTIGLPFSDDYFAAIRAVYQRRAADPRLQGLTFALLGVAAPADLIKDPNRTPFNVGRRIELTDFTREEAAPLLKGLAPEPDLCAKLLDRVLFWTGGHPYLSQKTCQLVARWAQERWNPSLVPSIVDETVKESFFTPASRRTDSNLQLVADRVSGRNGAERDGEKQKLLAVYSDILRGARVPDEELDPVRGALKLSGLVVPGTAGLQIRNAIYRTVFDEVWVRSLLDEGPTPPAAAAVYDVFVSYSHEDQQWVREYLVPQLKTAGLRVASDLDLLPGASWAEDLKRMRESSEYFLPVLSPAWYVSRGAQEEFEIMSNRVGKIVPVLLQPTRIPSFLADIYYADFTDPSKQPLSLERLVEALGGRRAGVGPGAPAPVSVASAPSAASLDQLASDLATSFDREALIKLAAERFPGDWQRILQPFDALAPVEVMAAALVEFAAQSGALQALSAAVAMTRSAATPQTPSPRPATSGAYHAFVAMPFGRKQDIDFNSIYQELVRPALEGAGFNVFRADEELRAGDIRTDMFQELLLADLVVADLSIDNPNTWYELGVRHALRARGVIQIQGVREYMPFDVYVDRALRYHIRDGKPDPEFIEADRSALAAFATEAMQSRDGRKISPVYHLLPLLKEPDWKSLRLEQATDFWAAQDDWERRIQVARRLGRAGDILVLAGEAPSRALRASALCSAARALRSLGQYTYALEQCERALELAPEDRENRRSKGLLLSRLKRFDESREWLKAILAEHPGDAEAWGLLGRSDMDAWISCWRKPGGSSEDMQSKAAAEAWRLRQSIDAYANGFTADPHSYWTGLKAVTLLHLLEHLTGDRSDADRRTVMEGGVRWGVMSELRKNPSDYWASVSAADLAALSQDQSAVERTYREAVGLADRDWFRLDSSREQLTLLNDLQFRPEIVQAALHVIDRAMSLLERQEEPQKPAQVILFSGHMIDRSDRSRPRFPGDRESVAAAAIDAVLRELDAKAGDLALCGGANGGDLLFAEACLTRGLRLEVRIPFEEPRFLRESVSFAGDAWRKRFFAVKGHTNTRLFVATEELGATPASVDPFSRNNLWQLYSALAWGDERLRFVCLWDGQGGDGPGGTRHMYEAAHDRAGHVHHINTATLFGLPTST